MTDNINVTPGAGATVAADLVGGALYQRVKLAIGADGEAADLDSGQQTMANSVPMTLASDQTDVKVTLDGEAVVLGSVVPGTAATNLGKAEDAAHSSGDTGVMTLGVRQDTMAPLAADGDYVPPTTDANGQMRVLAGSPDFVVSVTPTLDTNAYAAGDLLFDSTEIAAAVRANGGTAILQSITMLDKADQGVDMTLVFANAATDFGTLNAAPDPDDTESGTVIGHVAVFSGDYVDLGANRVACVRNVGLMLKAGAATTSLYVAGINGTGTPTYAASDLVIQFGFMRS
jgi:hypothetical protein